MADKKLTVGEIKKALEHCAGLPCLCSDCILFEPEDDDCQCSSDLKLNALDLINRQKAEVEKWQGGYMTQKQEIANLEIELKAMRGAANSYKAEIEGLNQNLKEAHIDIREHLAKNEQLVKIKSPLVAKQLNAENINIAHIKAEAYKECIEKVKEKNRSVGILRQGDLDNLLKELVGEDK